MTHDPTSERMKILTVVGARPQFIKAAVVSRVIADTPDATEVLVHTGQHYDAGMSRVFFDELAIREPDHHLEIGSGPHGAQTGRMLEAIERVLQTESPDWVLVYGDTNSTLAGALAAAKLHVPVAHVEAGLRSFNRRMPEEVNRVLTDHVSDVLFAPTAAAVENLAREGVPAHRVHPVGDVMLDAARFYGELAARRSGVLDRLSMEPGTFCLATVHRAENTDDPERLRSIVEGLILVANRMPVIFPVHPRTRGALQAAGLWERAGAALNLLEPLGYLDITMLQKSACLVLTDSGGVQKEAFFHGVPCVTLRDETEWVELTELGWNRLVPTATPESILHASIEMADRAQALEVGRDSPYGDGHAGEKIVGVLRDTAF